ncbi:MAG: hypothetical protein JRH20_05355 [Deltaproteobacteria bacterium]|nr:hypothetical protein [Deltaproteobacteria bacterium]
MTRQLITLILLTTTLSACFNTQRVPMTHKIRVTSTPPGAHIWREDKGGRQAVGQAPLVLEERYERVTRKVKPSTWIVWVTSVVLSAGLFVAAALTDNDTPKNLEYVGGGTLAFYSLVMLPSFALGDLAQTRQIPLTVGASSPGYSDAWLKLQIPASLKKKKGGAPPLPNANEEHEQDEQDVHITLSPAGGKAASAAPTTRPKAEEPKRPIVAVFDLEDNKNKLTAEIAGELAEYLATQLTATGRYRTIPRSQLRRRLSGEKQKGYKACFDEACQIELGRALAAQKSLATKIIRIGTLCTMTSVLYDLKSETSERAASTEGACTTTALLAALRAQAKKLAGVKE